MGRHPRGLVRRGDYFWFRTCGRDFRNGGAGQCLSEKGSPFLLSIKYVRKEIWNVCPGLRRCSRAFGFRSPHPGSGRLAVGAVPPRPHPPCIPRSAGPATSRVPVFYHWAVGLPAMSNVHAGLGSKQTLCMGHGACGLVHMLPTPFGRIVRGFLGWGLPLGRLLRGSFL